MSRVREGESIQKDTISKMIGAKGSFRVGEGAVGRIRTKLPHRQPHATQRWAGKAALPSTANRNFKTRHREETLVQRRRARIRRVSLCLTSLPGCWRRAPAATKALTRRKHAVIAAQHESCSLGPRRHPRSNLLQHRQPKHPQLQESWPTQFLPHSLPRHGRST